MVLGVKRPCVTHGTEFSKEGNLYCTDLDYLVVDGTYDSHSITRGPAARGVAARTFISRAYRPESR